jgi:dienelactone hydrolase
MQDPQATGLMSKLYADSVDTKLTQISTPTGAIRARLYFPDGKPDAPGLVVLHGVHHLGIDEPRLVAFARSLSSSGVKVLTPELTSLADYKVDPASVDVIGYSAREFAGQTGRRVGVLGLSFSGGLSLLAAADPHFTQSIAFVVSVGAHDDLQRVSQYLITSRINRPDGTTFHLQAHEYGALILIYSHLEDFFPAVDAPVARDALRTLLWEQVDEARKLSAQLSPESRQKMDLLFDHHLESFIPQIETMIAQHQNEMSAVSPHGQLSSLHVPVLLLHGAADNVIPPTELLWLQQDIPQNDLRGALTSAVLSHLDMQRPPSFKDELALVDFMAQIFELLDREKRVNQNPNF